MKRKTLYSLLTSHKKNIFFGIIGLTMVDMMQLLVPILVGKVIDILASSKTDSFLLSDLNKYALYLIICGVVMAIFRFVWRFFLLGTSRKIEKNLRDNYFSRVQNLTGASFQNHSPGDLMARGVNDIETIKMACGFGIVVAYDGIVLLTFIFISMFLISPIFTLYASGPFIIMSILILKYGDIIERLFSNVQSSFSNLTEEARRIIYSIRVIKSLNDQEEQSNLFKKKSIHYESMNINLIKIWAGYQPLITFLSGLSIFVFIFFGSNMVLEGKLSIGDFSALMVYLTMLSWPVVAMGLAVDWLKRGNACLSRVDKIMTQDTETNEAGLAKIEKIDKVSFDNVSFTKDSNNILSNINFNIKRGSSLGITGKTGAGKTTLINLLLKYSYSDNIKINNISINDIDKNSIRKKIVYVPQNPVIFSGTLAENVSFFEENPDENKIIECLRISGFINDLERMKNGLNEIVGERGVSLSGGQRQRVSIARAIYQNPEMIILDDTLSSLDVDTELQILRNIKDTFREKFLIVISSRVSTIFLFDEIIVLDSGEIVQKGSSKSLEEQEGLFKDLLAIQRILPGVIDAK